MLWTALVRTAKRISKTSKSSCRTRIHNYICTRSGRLAQLVQSTCLTSRGSGVRIPHRPQLKRVRKPSTKVGGFFVLARLKLASKSDQKKKAKRCGAADGFLSLFSWVQGHQRRVLSPLGEKSPCNLVFLLFWNHTANAATRIRRIIFSSWN